MQKNSITLLLATLLASNVFAATNNMINIPFISKAVPVEGLMAYYNTGDKQKIVCIADNFYKGYLYITEDGIEKDTGIAYGNYSGTQFYFSSIEKTNDAFNQFHIDKKGYIKFKDTNYISHKSYVSCFYLPEATNK